MSRGNAAGHPRRCAATSKSTGKQCKNYALVESTTCRMHLGEANKRTGLAHHNTRSGEYSTNAPARLTAHMEAFTDSVASGQYLVLAEDINLAHSLVIDALSKLDTGESRRRANDIRDTWREFREATTAGDREAVAKLAARLDRITGEDASYFDAVDNVYRAQSNKVKLVESERKRVKEGQNMMTTLEAYAFMSNVLQAVRNNVNDPDALQRISNEVANAGASFVRDK